MPKTPALPEIGSKFGRLTVVQTGLHMPPTRSQAAAGRPGNRAVLAVCDCGNEKLTRLYTMRSGRTLSCGCIKIEQTKTWWSDPEYVAEQKARGSQILSKLWSDPDWAAATAQRMAETNRRMWSDPDWAAMKAAAIGRRATTHGLARRPLYSVHRGMLARCYVPTAKGYKNWGARGIGVYGSWHAVEVAIPQMETILGPRPQGSTLDRINNNGHYEPGNIRWATPREQSLNIGHGEVIPIGGPPCNRGSSCLCRG